MAEQLRPSQLQHKQAFDSKRQKKAFGYRVRQGVKERLADLHAEYDEWRTVKRQSGEKLPVYRLPDGTQFEINFDPRHADLVLNGIECYLSQDSYDSYLHIVKGLHLGFPQVQVYNAGLTPQQQIQLSSFGRPQEKKAIKTHFKSVSLRNEISLNFTSRAPIIEELFNTIKNFCQDEEIKEYEQIKNILITGGGSQLANFNKGHETGKSLGLILEEKIMTALAQETIP